MSSLSNYAKRMARLSARIFGEVARPTSVKSQRVVTLFSELPNDLNPDIVAWYPPHHQLTTLMFRLRMHGLYRDEHQDFKEEMRRLRRLRGKGRPKKGEGKRATLAKK
ncbi:28S ribosomal protein S33, mitochondrial [Ixodes scapularis]|uniref:Small ribosomal subunit protein mS33 n=2 Tax=Ixodes TaxID=6944 RepID=B7Q9S4_IXOSC|nr:28S ribosomal protein S33, mitochondrial [Ixodes scapularis]EEC15596.1 ribosomal protein S33, putative [Ixodes scapularis]|eukprot:XP_002406324.1 ribosomal protein S33, putative [Ixodes scapularis]